MKNRLKFLTTAAIAVSSSAYAADPVVTGATTRTDTTSTTTTPVLGGTNTETTATTTWNTERKYWQDTYPTRSYYTQNRQYTTYEPAYRYGVETYYRTGGRNYTDLNQEELRKGWEQARDGSTLTWEEAQSATRDAYGRLYEKKTTTQTLSPAR
jgi:hypothetical protein